MWARAMDSPSVGSDSVIINPGPNSSEARMHNFDSLGDDLESPELTGSQRKKRGPRPGGAEKGGRGLRHFSMKVCEKVELKRRTTYNEVADELIAEITNEESLLSSVDQTRPHATVEVEISEDMQLVHFDFNSTPFELHDDAFVLKAMRLSNLANNEQSFIDGTENIVKLEHVTEDTSAQPQRQKRHMPSFKSGGNRSNSLPLPGILKARVKQEYHT